MNDHQRGLVTLSLLKANLTKKSHNNNNNNNNNKETSKPWSVRWNLKVSPLIYECENPCVSDSYIYGWSGLKWSEAINWLEKFLIPNQVTIKRNEFVGFLCRHVAVKVQSGRALLTVYEYGVEFLLMGRSSGISPWCEFEEISDQNIFLFNFLHFFALIVYTLL